MLMSSVNLCMYPLSVSPRREAVQPQAGAARGCLRPISWAQGKGRCRMSKSGGPQSNWQIKTYRTVLLCKSVHSALECCLGRKYILHCRHIDMTVRLVSFRRVSALLQGSQFESDRDAGVQVAQFEHMDAPWAVVIDGVFLTLSSIGVPFFFYSAGTRASCGCRGESFVRRQCPVG